MANMGDEEVVGHTVLPSEPASVFVARQFVRSSACASNIVVPGGDLTLVVSELVTNAVEHGAGPVEVVVRRWGGGVQIEVTTAVTPGRPERLDPYSTRSSGRGLLIVEALASAWGHRDHDRQRTVWARFTH